MNPIQPHTTRIATLALLGIALLAPLTAASDKPAKTGLFEVKAEKHKSFYLLDVPDDYSKARTWPLVVSLHGSGDYARDFVGVLLRHTRAAGYILAVPNGDARLPIHQGPQRTWSGRSPAFIMAMVEEIRKTYRIDPDRIYLHGFSAGAAMAYLCGITKPDVFDAIVPCAGVLVRGFTDAHFKKAIHLPILVLVGKKDRGYAWIRQSYTRLKTAGFKDITLREFADLGHQYPHTENPHVIRWLDERFEKKLKSRGLDTWIAQGTKAVAEKRWADALRWLRPITDHNLSTPTGEKAAELLMAVEEHGFQVVEQARVLAEKKAFVKALNLLRNLAEGFQGLDCARAAQEMEQILLEDPEVRRAAGLKPKETEKKPERK